MDDLDARLRAAFRSLTEPTDLEASERAIAVAIRAADRRPRRATVGRLAVAAAALLVVAVAGGTAVITGGRPVLTNERSAAPAVSGTAAPAVSRSDAPSAVGSPVAAAPPRLDWFRQPLEGPPAGPGTMVAITAGGPGLIAVGSGRDTSHHHNTPTSERHHVEAVAWTSLDGGPWWRVAGQPGFVHAAMQDVAWSRDALVAVGYDDSDPEGTITTRLWSSRDGATWTALPETTIPVDTRLTRVLGTPAGFLASGVERGADGIARGVVWRSADGAAWARATDPATFEGGRLDAIFEIGDDLVAIGQKRGDLRINPPLLWRSGDGSDWEAVPLSDDAFGSDLAGIAAIAAGGPGYIAVGTAIDRLSPQDPTTQIAWPPTDGAIWTSPDLRTWTRVEPARELFGGQDNQAINSVVAIRGGYIALGSAGPGAGAWSSADGERWERIELPEAATGTVDDAVVMNGAIIGVGGADRAPAVWRGVRAADSANSPAAVAGVEAPISIYTHCGLDRSRIDFDGSFWDPVGETSDGQDNPPDGYDNPYDSGTIRLLPDGTSEFTSSQGVRLRLERISAARSFEPCA